MVQQLATNQNARAFDRTRHPQTQGLGHTKQKPYQGIKVHGGLAVDSDRDLLQLLRQRRVRVMAWQTRAKAQF